MFGPDNRQGFRRAKKFWEWFWVWKEGPDYFGTSDGCMSVDDGVIWYTRQERWEFAVHGTPMKGHRHDATMLDCPNYHKARAEGLI